MKTELAFDVMTGILPDVAQILNDPELAAAKAACRAKNQTASQAMTALLPFFLEKHRAQVLHIFAALQGKTVEEIGQAPFTEAVIQLVADRMEEVLLFFAWCLRMAMQA